MINAIIRIYARIKENCDNIMTDLKWFSCFLEFHNQFFL